MAKPTEPAGEGVPLGDVSDDELSSLVDDVLRSGLHRALPSPATSGAKNQDEKVTQLAAAIAPKEARAWKPHAGELRKTLPPNPPAPISPATTAGTFYVLPAPAPPQPPAANTLAHSIVTGVVTGVVAGLVVAAVLLIARAVMPPSAPARIRGTSQVEAPRAPAPKPPPEPAAKETPQRAAAAPVHRELATEIPQEPKPTVYIPPAPALPERLGQADVLSVVAAHRSDIQRCIDQHRPEDSPEGRVVIRWTIHPDGTTSGASVAGRDLRDSELARCFLGLVSAWTFPRHSADMEPVEIPFVF